MAEQPTPPPAPATPPPPAARKGINVIDRAKNILITPIKEWPVIEAEPHAVPMIYTSFVLPLLFIGGVATFIGQGLIGVRTGFGQSSANLESGLVGMLLFLVFITVLIYAVAAAIDVLGPSFGAQKNWKASFQTAAYSLTAMYIGSFFFIFPALWILVLICSLYSLYPLYTGLPIMKKTPADKQVAYFAVILIVTVLLFILISILEKEIIKAFQPNPYRNLRFGMLIY